MRRDAIESYNATSVWPTTLLNMHTGLERPSLSELRARLSNRSISVELKNLVHQEHTNHVTFLNACQEVEMLTEAFQSLTSLETIEIRDFNSNSRHRDWPSVHWRSYGIKKFEVETSAFMILPAHSGFGASELEREEHLNRVFLSLLRGLGKARRQIKNFEVILRHRKTLGDNAFNLPKYIVPTVHLVLANLRTLFLDLSSSYYPVEVETTPGQSTACASYLLRKFLSRLEHLEHLRLNFRQYRHDETNDIISWLSKPVATISSVTSSSSALPPSPPPVEFEHLQQLDIGMTVIEPKYLIAVIQKLRSSLRTISLHKVSLLHRTPPNSDDKERVNVWAEFFRRLSKLDLSLTAINMSSLSQEEAERRHGRRISFRVSNTLVPDKKWAGSNLASGLRDFEAQVVVNWPEHDTDSEVEPDDDDDHDESDDADEVDDTNSDDEDGMDIED
jgi:hypothetical protein